MKNQYATYASTVGYMDERGITLDDIAQITFDNQIGYLHNLTFEDALESVQHVVGKREAQHLILTALALDEMVESKSLPEPLLGIIERDEGVFGVDEVLAMSMATLYGTIGITNYGYMDKEKPGLIGKLDQLGKNTQGITTTFADDIVGAIAAAAAARLAHKYPAGKPE